MVTKFEIFEKSASTMFDDEIDIPYTGKFKIGDYVWYEYVNHQYDGVFVITDIDSKKFGGPKSSTLTFFFLESVDGFQLDPNNSKKITLRSEKKNIKFLSKELQDDVEMYFTARKYNL